MTMDSFAHVMGWIVVLVGTAGLSVALLWLFADRISAVHEAIARPVVEATRAAVARDMRSDSWWFSEDVITMELLQALAEKLSTGSNDTSAVRAPWEKARAVLKGKADADHEHTRQLYAQAQENHHREYHRIAEALKCHVHDDFPTLIVALRERLEKADRFKVYVHQRLDGLGVPVDPEPEKNAQHGCRIEGRMNWLVDHRIAGE
jgi:hypothetical protein